MDIKEKGKEKGEETVTVNVNENLNNNSLLNLGARVLGLVSKDKNINSDKSSLTNNSKGILKKNVSFDNETQKKG